MKRKNAKLAIELFLGLGDAVCKSISREGLCEVCPQKENCKPWLFQPEVDKKLADWYLGKLGYFKEAK